jgi:hypothetical protein
MGHRITAGIALFAVLLMTASGAVSADSVEGKKKVDEAVTRGLDFLVREQRFPASPWRRKVPRPLGANTRAASAGLSTICSMPPSRTA